MTMFKNSSKYTENFFFLLFSSFFRLVQRQIVHFFAFFYSNTPPSPHQKTPPFSSVSSLSVLIFHLKALYNLSLKRHQNRKIWASFSCINHNLCVWFIYLRYFFLLGKPLRFYWSAEKRIIYILPNIWNTTAPFL